MKISFTEIFNNYRIMVPIIQRDYAQGRTDGKTTVVRTKFLEAIFNTIRERVNLRSKKVLELDFIYGYCNGSEVSLEFVPIDGQQRLTTLWLFYWFVAEKEGIEPSEKEFLKLFDYETRHSTHIFCEKLTAFTPTFSYQSIDQEIRDQSWFFDLWNYDPSISSMMVMLRDIEANYTSLGNDNIWSILIDLNSPYLFYMLDMGKVGLPDDLYIKMNSRGKPLTDFEYFKAGFLEIISNEELRNRFENSIDGIWYEFIWETVRNIYKDEIKADLAYLADDAFLRLINYITDILAYKSELSFTEINYSNEETKAIYFSEDNLIFLFNSLDALANLHENNKEFWFNYFYSNKNSSKEDKVRLFFQNRHVNLVENCLRYYQKSGRGFTLPEQLLFYACILQFIHKTPDFQPKIRVIRNLIANSENELRISTIGTAFKEIENFVLKNDLDLFTYFKTDQIKEEKEKRKFLNTNPSSRLSLYRLEDSNIFRGSISIFNLDQKFSCRANKFLEIFDEDIIRQDFISLSNLLLCFGDYTQDDGDLTNILSQNERVWRYFFTTPGYNKYQFFQKTNIVLMQCLDYFIDNPDETIKKILEQTLNNYQHQPKDWRYYFFKYEEFRYSCNQGYYLWRSDNDYICYKMKERQRNGQHWDPFLQEIKRALDNSAIELSNYGEDLQITVDNDILSLRSESLGFRITNNNSSVQNMTYNLLVSDKIIDATGLYKVPQNSDGIDLEDRIEHGIILLNKILSS